LLAFDPDGAADTGPRPTPGAVADGGPEAGPTAAEPRPDRKSAVTPAGSTPEDDDDEAPQGPDRAPWL
jgi:hypothetical protein